MIESKFKFHENSNILDYCLLRCDLSLPQLSNNMKWNLIFLLSHLYVDTLMICNNKSDEIIENKVSQVSSQFKLIWFIITIKYSAYISYTFERTWSDVLIWSSNSKQSGKNHIFNMLFKSEFIFPSCTKFEVLIE